MWRSLARRAWLHSRADVSKLRRPFADALEGELEAVILSRRSVQSASSVSRFSASSQFYPGPVARFFSSNSAESYEEPPFETLVSEANETAGAFGAGLDNSAYSGLDNEDSVFDKEGSAEGYDPSAGMHGGLDALEMEDDGLARENENDLESVESLLSLLQSRGVVDGPLGSQLDEMDLAFSQDLVLKVLETPQISGENLVSFFRWVLKKQGFKVTSTTLDAFVNAVCLGDRKRDAYASWDMVKELGVKKKEVVSTEILNKLVGLFSRIGEGKAAYDVFSSFEELGCSMTGDTYFLTIVVLCRRSLNDLARSVCEKMLSADKLPNVKIVGEMISYLCRAGMATEAHLLYRHLKDKNMTPSGSPITQLVNSFSSIKKFEKGAMEEGDKEHDRATVSLALELLNDYSAEDRKYAVKPFTRVVKKLCWIEDVGRAKSLVLEVTTSGPPPGNDAFNCVINGLTKAGDVVEALSMMKLMKSRGLKPDVYTYNVVMSGFTKAGEVQEALRLFNEAKRKHQKLSPITFHILIRGFCKLEQFNKAVDLFGEMKEHGIRPNHDEYNKLIKSLCLKALDWETAEKLQEEMKTDGLILNGRTSSLIAAVRELKSSQS